MAALDPYFARADIAYFSMEIALRPEMHTYSGGLGVLAGDMVRSCADLELPIVFVTLVSRAGYVRQSIDADGRQIADPDPWEPERWAVPLDAMVAVEIEQRPVWIRSWLYAVTSPGGGRVPVVLLDTNVDHNTPADRSITDALYGGDDTYRLMQEIVLGIGGARMLRALGFAVETWHMNEGHAALLTLDLLRAFPKTHRDPDRDRYIYDIDRVRECCVFTTHTPVEAGQDQFSYDVAERLLDGFIEIDQVRLLAGEDRLNMTRLALNLSRYVNGVAERHAETTRRMFPGYQVRAVTNGVHLPTWTHPRIAALLHELLPSWSHEPELLTRAERLDDAALWQAHQAAKQDLIRRAGELTGVALRPDWPILGFARRMTGYKRPNLLFTDPARLRAIHARFPFQIVIAGKAHPRDEPGQDLIALIHAALHDLRDQIPGTFLPGYDMTLAQLLVAGSDVWLNTPLPPLEASGTSGMKAAANGVLNLSVLDGWWVEACVHGLNGWGFGSTVSDATDPAAAHATELYRLLEDEVLPCYHGDRRRWVNMMKHAFGQIASYFNTQRVLRRYATEAYMR